MVGRARTSSSDHKLPFFAKRWLVHDPTTEAMWERHFHRMAPPFMHLETQKYVPNFFALWVWTRDPPPNRGPNIGPPRDVRVYPHIPETDRCIRLG